MGTDYSPLSEAVLRYTGLRVEREFPFHPTREWRFDFAIPQAHVAIEVEGGLWNGGRHFRPEGWKRDTEKYNEGDQDSRLTFNFQSSIFN